MFQSIQDIHQFLQDESVKLDNQRLNKVIKNYTLHYFNNEINSDVKKDIFDNIKQSKAVILYQDKNIDTKDQYFFIGFEKTIIIINLASLILLKPLFSNNSDLSICFLSNDQDIFNQFIDLPYKRIDLDSNYISEIKNFHKNFNFHPIRRDDSSIIKILNSISLCISSYLILKSHQKLKKNRIQKYFMSFGEERIIDLYEEEEFIQLRLIGSGSIFMTFLYYFIEKEELFVIKKPYVQSDKIHDLMKREIENYFNINNYLNINLIFFSQLFGIIKDKNYLIIEFIEGKELSQIEKLKLNNDEKITIISEIILSVKCLHEKNFISRDLKPNNIIIDQYKTAVLIDFDNVISADIKTELTSDFGSVYAAPEINSQAISLKSDIYSIGKIMFFIMNEKIPTSSQSIEIPYFEEYPDMKQLYLRCISQNPDSRPSIIELYDTFQKIFEKQTHIYELFLNSRQEYKQYYLKKINNVFIDNPFSNAMLGDMNYEGKYLEKNINTSINYYKRASDQNVPEAQYNLARIYHYGIDVECDIDQAIHYYQLAANQNFTLANLNLGVIYSNKNLSVYDIEKAIHYYTIAANQNNISAQYNLGITYLDYPLDKPDIKKAIYYFTLAADKEHAPSQYNLGVIYSDGNLIQRNIPKAIFYYTSAASQNHTDAQYNLGLLFYNSQFGFRNIEGAIHFFTLAADRNNIGAQLMLGEIYSNKQYDVYDIKKAIYYYSLAASKNNSDAQYNLGLIYYEFKKFDEAIKFYELAASQNFSLAQYNLGVIYYKGEVVKSDIHKSIHYLMLSASQNYSYAQFNLGYIYSQSPYVPHDLTKALHYYSLAANQDMPQAYYNIGLLYYDKKYDQYDMNKALHFISIAADNNVANAQFFLGDFYHYKKDFKKAIHYYSLAADQKYSKAMFLLGAFYYEGHYIQQDIKKGINYIEYSANQDYNIAQFKLGIILCEGKFIQRNANKGIYYLVQSAKNNCIHANFVLGCFYYEGKFVKQDIYKSIHYYKEASSFNDQFAKNNLGIIYKKGFSNKVPSNIMLAVEYLKEAALKKNDFLAIYNLSRIYLYDLNQIDHAVDLLFKFASHTCKSEELKKLLCFALILKNDFNRNKIEEELETQDNEIKLVINEMIKKVNLIDKKNFEREFSFYKEIELFYDYKMKVIDWTEINSPKTNKNSLYGNIKDISSEFYDGFGIDITNI